MKDTTKTARFQCPNCQRQHDSTLRRYQWYNHTADRLESGYLCETCIQERDREQLDAIEEQRRIREAREREYQAILAEFEYLADPVNMFREYLNAKKGF